MPALGKPSRLICGIGALAASALLLAAAPAAPAAPNPLAARPLYVQPGSEAAADAARYRAAHDYRDARLMERIASRPQAIWLSGSSNDAKTVRTTMASARARRRLPVFVLYDIPRRDCGSYSGGGARSAQAYRGWVNQIADRLGEAPAAVIVEPDALAEMSCWSGPEQNEVYDLIGYAARRLAARPGTTVYLDAGNAAWEPAAVMAGRLRRAQVSRVRGFALNVANFLTTGASLQYGDELSRELGGAHYVIDTSRNGRGPLWHGGSLAWCNPPGRGLGAPPTVHTASAFADAYLWIKTPGSSDGSCGGAPPAGTWWPSYALQLARNASGSA